MLRVANRGRRRIRMACMLCPCASAGCRQRDGQQKQAEAEAGRGGAGGRPLPPTHSGMLHWETLPGMLLHTPHAFLLGLDVVAGFAYCLTVGYVIGPAFRMG